MTAYNIVYTAITYFNSQVYDCRALSLANLVQKGSQVTKPIIAI